MKLLGWIHKKLGQNSSAHPLKHLFIGRGSDEKEEQEAWNDGIFPGFLAIGTLGLDPSSTPTFSICVENIITEKEDEVTENELKLINDELERVLADDDDSSGGGRSSHGSNTICPLEGYLFGTAVEVSTTLVAVSKNKEEQQQRSERTSLAELFQRNKLEDHNNLVGAKDDTDKEEAAMKKRVKKKRMVHGCSHTSDRKVHNKILQMFQKKIHPENPRAKMEHENKEQWIKTDVDYLVLEL